MVAGAVALVVVDQITKTIALRSLADGPVDVVWTLRFSLTFNSGFAFSQGEGLGPLLSVVALGVVGYLVYLAGKTESGLGLMALGLIAGGAAGNLADRVFRDGDGLLAGHVVDFIDLQWWPVFNVADMGITVGAAAMVLGALRE